MGENAMVEEKALILQGQVDMSKYMFHFADSMALKAAVELRIPDIIHCHGGLITLSQKTASLPDAPSPNPTFLARIMRLLVRLNIFAAHHPSDGGDTLYGLTHSSYGREIWNLASESSEFNKVINYGMECTARIVIKATVSVYKEGFESIGPLVDVGGGTGGTLLEIVKAHPHINCINFDLPHVVATAPELNGVTHVEGDMFHSVPNADAVFMKWILHDWGDGDEDCIKILKNYKKAVEGKVDGGKVIIAEFVLKPDGKGLFDDTSFVFDLLMIAHTSSSSLIITSSTFHLSYPSSRLILLSSSCNFPLEFDSQNICSGSRIRKLPFRLCVKLNCRTYSYSGGLLFSHITPCMVCEPIASIEHPIQAQPMASLYGYDHVRRKQGHSSIYNINSYSPNTL